MVIFATVIYVLLEDTQSDNTGAELEVLQYISLRNPSQYQFSWNIVSQYHQFQIPNRFDILRKALQMAA